MAQAGEKTEYGTTTGMRDRAALQSWLGDRIDGFGAIQEITKFPGGQSNPTYRIEASGGTYVLRRKPFGPILPSAHAVEREYRLIAALHPTGFPVARPYALCEDDAIIGSAFYVMEMVAGRSLYDGALPELDPAGRGTIYAAMVDTLADLHEIRPDAVKLAGYGPPGNYFERQVRRWTKQYRASQTDDLPEVERLIAWLPATLPAQDRVSIIHGDYRIDNLIFAADGPAIRAVLDWELATLGDPLADFAYFAMNWAMPRTDRGAAALGGLDLPMLGIPGLAAITARYCRRTGRDSMPDLAWYFAYNLFRLVGIIQGIRKRILDGNASSASAAETAARFRPLAEQAWRFARAAGA